jgi:hypothetical protein
MAGARNLTTLNWMVISNEPLEFLPKVVPTNNVTKVPRIQYETFILLAITVMATVRFLGVFVKNFQVIARFSS